MSSSGLNRTLSNQPVGGNGLHHGLNCSGLEGMRRDFAELGRSSVRTFIMPHVPE
jgi:hypothetical protein